MTPPSKEYKWGYINKQGEIVIEPRFDGANGFLGGLASVEIKDRGQGYIDKAGRYIWVPAS